MAAAEGGAGFEFAFEGSGEGYDEEVGGGVEADGENAKDGELEEDVAAFGCDELRNEGEEEEGRLGIESFGEDALTERRRRGWLESVACWSGSLVGDIFRKRSVAGADHFYAEEDEIGGTGVLNGVESYGGSGEDGGDSEGGGEDVEESAEESAKRGGKTFAAASGEGTGEDIEDSGARSDSEKHRGCEE